jgi:hypothetical protein
VSAVESRPVEEFFELIAFRSLNDLLERHKIGRDSSELTIEQTDTTSIACEIPHVDGKDA